MKKLFLLTIFLVNHLVACTGFTLKSQDGAMVNGRTVEFGSDIEMSVAVVPRGYSFSGYKAKYAVAGIYCFEAQLIMDGINEVGLAVGAFYFPGYASYDKDGKFSPVDFPNWILTQFATVEEVKEALPKASIAPTVLKGWGPTPPPFHYIVYDKSGKSIVIEPLDGKLVVYDNELGVITNSPTFDWHMTNLRNYINLTPYNAAPLNLKDSTFAQFGEGSGMLGLPGDFTPPSRFVRAAFFSAAAIPSSQPVDQAFHILNQFDIPVGAVREKGEGVDYTLLTSVKDPTALRYYFRSYKDQTIDYIDLNQVDKEAKTIKSMKVQGQQSHTNVSGMLK